MSSFRHNFFYELPKEIRIMIEDYAEKICINNHKKAFAPLLRDVRLIAIGGYTNLMPSWLRVVDSIGPRFNMDHIEKTDNIVMSLTYNQRKHYTKHGYFLVRELEYTNLFTEPDEEHHKTYAQQILALIRYFNN